VLYAAMPYDAAYPGACNVISTSANGDLGADSEVNTLAHETEEATTDPLLNAWYDRRGQENADKCAWKFGTEYTAANGMPANMNLGGKDFLVQMNWVNAGSGGCAQSYTTP
jgi:Phosphate-induced protein 1 conserved region